MLQFSFFDPTSRTQPNLQLKSCFCCTVGWVKRQRNPTQPWLTFALKLPSSNQPGNLGDVGFFRWKCSANVPQPNLQLFSL
ncbi:MAG: hypothetical protein F6K40_00175 [Okeania sp. SIO3I5]|uniref:hypothetical protein n=1 Tax=Okeania sp. SIO3I5 TaxID=2607805 RepID=UPI0013BD4B7D|nr:hypothetical protein [Okeania sp. SIO3I5]NEQ34809.1 hypothetical protein [Okeania sp. SIO3I5]